MEIVNVNVLALVFNSIFVEIMLYMALVVKEMPYTVAHLEVSFIMLNLLKHAHLHLDASETSVKETIVMKTENPQLSKRIFSIKIDYFNSFK
jgi:hypothetical protein